MDTITTLMCDPGVAELTPSYGGTITNKIHFYNCEKLNSYERLIILWGKSPMPPVSYVSS